MATYKVIQDIEAEDKFVGPLTLKQFIFAMGGGLFGYLSFFVLSRGFFWALALTVPPCLFGFFMAIPWSKDQPTDVWVLAKLRFRLKPKKRLWDQDGVQQLVTITAPKVEEKPLTKNLSQTEVKSRLKVLAETIDSRGWAVKHAEFQNRAVADLAATQTSGRLVDLDTLPQEVPEATQTVPDILEEQPKIDALLEKSDDDRKEYLYKKMDRIRQGETLEDINSSDPLVAPPQGSSSDEDNLMARLKAQREAGDISTGNMHSIPSKSAPQSKKLAKPDDKDEDASSTEAEKAQASMTEEGSADILELARNNDLNISTIARQADKKSRESDEVVISLH